MTAAKKSPHSQCRAAGKAWAKSWAKSNKRLRMLDDLHRLMLGGIGVRIRSADLIRDAFNEAQQRRDVSVGRNATEFTIHDQVEAFERGAIAFLESYEAEHGPVAA